MEGSSYKAVPRGVEVGELPSANELYDSPQYPKRPKIEHQVLGGTFALTWQYHRDRLILSFVPDGRPAAMVELSLSDLAFCLQTANMIREDLKAADKMLIKLESDVASATDDMKRLKKTIGLLRAK